MEPKSKGGRPICGAMSSASPEWHRNFPRCANDARSSAFMASHTSRRFRLVSILGRVTARMNAVSLCAASTRQFLFSHLQRTMTSQASRVMKSDQCEATEPKPLDNSNSAASDSTYQVRPTLTALAQRGQFELLRTQEQPTCTAPDTLTTFHVPLAWNTMAPLAINIWAPEGRDSRRVS
jgi:hypothetical protein